MELHVIMKGLINEDPSLLRNSARMKGSIKDVAIRYFGNAEISTIKDVQDSTVFDQLKLCDSVDSFRSQVSTFLHNFVSQSGRKESIAIWAICTWAIVLDVITSSESNSIIVSFQDDEQAIRYELDSEREKAKLIKLEHDILLDKQRCLQREIESEREKARLIKLKNETLEKNQISKHHELESEREQVKVTQPNKPMKAHPEEDTFLLVIFQIIRLWLSDFWSDYWKMIFYHMLAVIMTIYYVFMHPGTPGWNSGISIVLSGGRIIQIVFLTLYVVNGLIYSFFGGYDDTRISLLMKRLGGFMSLSLYFVICSIIPFTKEYLVFNKVIIYDGVLLLLSIIQHIYMKAVIEPEYCD